MDDLIRRQTSVLTLLERGQKSRRYKFGEIWELNFDEIREALETVPPVDAVEVVRCYKCIHWDEDTVRRNSNDATWWNEAVCRKYSDDIWEVWKDADWFCADGERKTDG